MTDRLVAEGDERLLIFEGGYFLEKGTEEAQAFFQNSLRELRGTAIRIELEDQCCLPHFDTTEIEAQILTDLLKSLAEAVKIRVGLQSSHILRRLHQNIRCSIMKNTNCAVNGAHNTNRFAMNVFQHEEIMAYGRRGLLGPLTDNLGIIHIRNGERPTHQDFTNRCAIGWNNTHVGHEMIRLRRIEQTLAALEGLGGLLNCQAQLFNARHTELGERHIPLEEAIDFL